MKSSDLERYIGQVRVGPKGQIVIPKEIREMFGIEPGDVLMMFADKKRGIAIERANILNKIADAVFNHRRQDLPDNYAEATPEFAEAIRQAEQEDTHECD